MLAQYATGLCMGVQIFVVGMPQKFKSTDALAEAEI